MLPASSSLRRAGEAQRAGAVRGAGAHRVPHGGGLRRGREPHPARHQGAALCGAGRHAVRRGAVLRRRRGPAAPGLRAAHGRRAGERPRQPHLHHPRARGLRLRATHLQRRARAQVT